jgi:hypothetical protein
MLVVMVPSRSTGELEQISRFDERPVQMSHAVRQLVEQESFGSLSVGWVGGFEITDANFEGFALGFSSGGLGRPGVVGLHQHGDEYAGRGLEGNREGHRASCPEKRTHFAK